MLSGALIKVLDGVPVMIGMVMINQFAQANCLRSHILDVLTDKEVDLVINRTSQDMVLIRTMKTGQDMVITSAMKTGTMTQIMISDIKNLN